MPYSDDLSNEKAPKVKKLLPEGWRPFTIKEGKEATSKAGNAMFVFTIEDKETGYNEDIYIVRTEGKRWILKAMLASIGIQKNEEGKYVYEMSDFVGKDIVGQVIHEPNEYINRSGETIKTTQHKIVDFRSVDEHINKPEDIQWSE